MALTNTGKGEPERSADTGKQQVAIVTGASSGMGLGMTRALLEHGYRVVANSRTISNSKEPKPSAELVLVDGDIGTKETAIRVVAVAVSRFGRLDLLVNCAGIYMPKPFTKYTPEDFERMNYETTTSNNNGSQRQAGRCQSQRNGPTP